MRLLLNECVFTDPLPEGLLSVLQITDDKKMNIVEPLQITNTHVIVSTPHLCLVGLVKTIKTLWNKTSGQVLLFLRPPNPDTQKHYLDMILLPRNVPLSEVKLYVSALLSINQSLFI